jgi:hypothetical protein
VVHLLEQNLMTVQRHLQLALVLLLLNRHPKNVCRAL